MDYLAYHLFSVYFLCTRIFINISSLSFFVSIYFISLIPISFILSHYYFYHLLFSRFRFTFLRSPLTLIVLRSSLFHQFLFRPKLAIGVRRLLLSAFVARQSFYCFIPFISSPCVRRIMFTRYNFTIF